ncbi:hypothetical protein [Richelia sinica]|uniref:hypothetical protein n=1 Tax=Richelia sinica TaxID=1357545 RepID=UPI001683D700|nr:hypothetical protein [Richelia sinica]MBD2667389.1 hypothetical protein [Richelia sinica FACHB-800]
MKLINGMSYREWQQRNKEKFEKLTKDKKKEARNQGYYNVGWDKVLNSWEIIRLFNNIVSLFEHKVNKGDILGAIDQSIIEANQAKILAQETVETLIDNQAHIDKLVDETLRKYPTL